jgi:uncharacterized membrane protein
MMSTATLEPPVSKTKRLLKTILAIFGSLTLLATTGCRTTNVSSNGGVLTLNEQFTIAVPAEYTIKQGTEIAVGIELNRGEYFKRDVQLDIKAEGIKVSPHSILVKASDKPQVTLQVAASREAALGDYRVSVTGTPTTGRPAFTLFIVKVIAQ